jgi:hypothetical protein
MSRIKSGWQQFGNIDLVRSRFRPHIEPLEERCLPSVLTVTSSADSGPGTLRAALAAASAGDTISFALTNPSTIHLTSGTLNVVKSVAIQGPGTAALTIQGNGLSADFLVQASSSISGLTISGGGGTAGGGIINSSILYMNNCAVTNNNAGEGGGIENSGALYLNNCDVSSNTCGIQGGGINAVANSVTTITGSTINFNSVQARTLTLRGGGIYSDGQLTLINSTLFRDIAGALVPVGGGLGGATDDAYGGGVFSDADSSLTIISCTFNNNQAVGGAGGTTNGGAARGGGVYFGGANVGPAALTDCTFFQNQCFGGASNMTGGDAFGGGIEWVGAASPVISDCTIYGNLADPGRSNFGSNGVSSGGGLYTNGNGTLLNTIVAQNGAPSGIGNGHDIQGNLTTAMGDLVGDGSGSNVMTGGTLDNQVGTPQSPIQALLGLLQNNGGPTQTLMPMPNSPAIDRGDNALLHTSVDQRGDPRVVNGIVDIGAVEVQQIHLIATGAGYGMPPEIKVYDAATGQLRLDFMAYEPSFMGGVRVAVADMNGDGVPDIVTAPGGVQVTLVNVNGALVPSFDFSAGRAPEIKVFSGVDGHVIDDFLAYPASFTAGLFVAVADVNGDGTPDIITGPDATGQPDHTNVRVFYFNPYQPHFGEEVTPDVQFNAYDRRFGGGVRVAAADFNGDSSADIVTAPGIWSGPDVRIWDGKALTQQMLSMIGEFLAYDYRYFGGVFVSVGDVNGDGMIDIVTGTNGNGGPETKAFSGVNVLSSPTPTIVDDFFAYDPAFNGGDRVAVVDVNGDGKADIITGAGPGGGPHVRIFDGGTGNPLTNAFDSFMAFDPSFSGGVFVGGA